MKPARAKSPKRFRGGLFITFEGIDGCGKSTQVRLASAYLKKLGYGPLTLREPGSAPVSEKIRRILLNRGLSIDPYPELFLYLAARGQLVSEVIAPALRDGRIILCDRFHDSTVAYQGYGRRLDLKLIEQMRRRAVGAVTPDLTFIFDIDLKTSLTRRKRRADRLERESELFFKRVRSGFRRIARKNPRRGRLIDARPDTATVFECVKRELDLQLKSRKRRAPL
ncbi:MAG: dTMP kinase [Candidatus Zixiibacteriota bacterium]